MRQNASVRCHEFVRNLVIDLRPLAITILLKPMSHLAVDTCGTITPVMGKTQCAAETEKRRRCTRNAVLQSPYCKQHARYSQIKRRRLFKRIALWVGVAASIVTLLSIPFIMKLYAPSTVEIVSLLPVYLHESAFIDTGGEPFDLGIRGVGAIARVRCTSGDVSINGIEFSGRRYLSKIEATSHLGRYPELRKFAGRTYQLIEFHGTRYGFSEPLRLKKGEEAYVPFMLVEPTIVTEGSRANKSVVGFEDGPAPERVRDHWPKTADFFEMRGSVGTGRYFARRNRNEIRQGQLGYTLETSIGRLPVIPDKVLPVRLIRISEWRTQTPQSLFVPR